MQTPTHINYDRASARLTIQWPDQTDHVFSAEFLRVHSPSAEVRGHGIGQEVLQFGKKDVMISGLENAGRYALKITFDDGHDSGLFDWNYLRSLGDNQTQLWQTYLEKLDAAGKSREPQFISVKQL